MASIWSRNKIWGGTFTTDVDVADNANNASQVPASSFFNFKFSTIVDATLTRSKYLTTVIAQSLRATLHKEEDRATGANIGVSGTEIESIQTVYTTPEQLPEVDKLTNDFTVPIVEADGDLGATQNMFAITIDNANRKNKSFKVNFSAFAVKWLLARTWKESQLVTLINNTLFGEGSTAGIIPVGVIWDYPNVVNDPNGFLNLCIETSGNIRSISKSTTGAGTLKDDKYRNLFVFLYLSYSDTLCPVSGGRSGADETSANNDFTSGKAITLPDYRGRVGGYYKAGDTNFGEIGKEIGTETINAIHLPITSPWRAVDAGHSHGYTNTKYNNTSVGENSGGGEDARRDENDTRPTPESSSANISMTTNNITGGNVADGGQKHFQPTKIQSAIIKY